MKKRVLVIDDCSLVRKTITKILTDEHYQVVGQAQDGAQGLEYFDRQRPDVVTVDLAMPGKSGIEVIREILLLDKKAKIVVVSGLTHEVFVMEAIYAGALDFIAKPFTKRELLLAVERALLGEEYIFNKSVATG